MLAAVLSTHYYNTFLIWPRYTAAPKASCSFLAANEVINTDSTETVKTVIQSVGI